MTSTSYTKPKHECIKPEDLVINTSYAFTLNMRDQLPMNTVQYHYFNKFIGTYHTYINGVYKSLNELKGSVLDTRLEVSQLGRIHLHGTIRVHSKFNFYVRDVRLLTNIGTLSIKELKEPEVWTEYCQKQAHIFLPVHTEYADSVYLYTNDPDQRYAPLKRPEVTSQV